MKALILALSVLASASAAAGEFTYFGRIFFQSASTWVPANKVCQSGGYFFHKTKSAIEVCRDDRDHGSCRKSEMRPLVQPIVSTRTICVRSAGGDNDRCLETGSAAYVQSPKAPVAVYRNYQAFDKNHAPARNYTYTIPACAAQGGYAY